MLIDDLSGLPEPQPWPKRRSSKELLVLEPMSGCTERQKAG